MNSSIPVICCTWVLVITFVILANIKTHNNKKSAAIISVIAILLTSILSVLYFICNIRCPQTSSEHFLVHGKRYVTLTQSPESCKSLGEFPKDGSPYDDNTVGLIHARMCLENLIILARKTGRTAILPPPWLYLSRWHNNGQYINDNVWWDRYYNLDELIETEDVAPKDLLIHDTKKQRGKILLECDYVEPDTSHKTIKKSPTQLITMHCYEGWGGNKENAGWTCGGTEFGGGIGHGWQRSLTDISFEPSNTVLETAAKIKNELGGEFVLVHVRRGDSLIIDSYWGIEQKDMHKITSSDYIATFLQEHNIDTNTSILIMTNESDINHFADLKNLYPKTKLESELVSLKDIIELQDNFLTYEIMRKVASQAKTRISTAPCYFDSKCEFALGENISTMITHESASGSR